MRKNVLHLLASNSYSGAENVVCTIIDNCSDKYDMYYCSPDGPIRDILEKRNIKFISSIAISDGKHTISAVAEINGKLADEVRGENGFGFDEIFELSNGKTLAEISSEEKNELSARRMALEKLKEKLSC